MRSARRRHPVSSVHPGVINTPIWGKVRRTSLCPAIIRRSTSKHRTAPGAARRGRQAAGHRQWCAVPVFGRGELYHGHRAGDRWRHHRRRNHAHRAVGNQTRLAIRVRTNPSTGGPSNRILAGIDLFAALKPHSVDTCGRWRPQERKNLPERAAHPRFCRVLGTAAYRATPTSLWPSGSRR